MSEIKVSIIVPVYNAEKKLEKCVSSLREQTLSEIEIILVDDGSEDNSPKMCDLIASSDSRVKVIHKQNEGAGKARNSGIEIAEGKYIGFVDSDDYVDKTMFEVLVDAMEKYTSDLVLSGVIHTGGCVFKKEDEVRNVHYFNEDTIFIDMDGRKSLMLGIIGSLPYEKEDSRYGMSVWKNLFKREIIEKNNLCFMSEREVMSEDSLFMIDYIACIDKAVGINDALYYYERNDESISKSYKKDRFEKSRIYIKEVRKRLEKYMDEDEYGIYLDRFIQSFSRFLCSQEVMYHRDNKIKFKELKSRLKMICEDNETVKVLKTYPVHKLPVKQAVFACAMKYKLYFIQKLIIGLKDR